MMAVTNRHLCDRDFLEQIEFLASTDIDAIILREKDMTPDEYAKIVIDSMAQKGSRGKGVYKISFRVLENHNTSDETQKLDMKSLLGIEKYNTPNKKI